MTFTKGLCCHTTNLLALDHESLLYTRAYISLYLAIYNNAIILWTLPGVDTLSIANRTFTEPLARIDFTMLHALFSLYALGNVN